MGLRLDRREVEVTERIDIRTARAGWSTSSHLEYRFRLLCKLFLCLGFSILTTLIVWSCWARNSCVPDLKECQLTNDWKDGGASPGEDVRGGDASNQHTSFEGSA